MAKIFDKFNERIETLTNLAKKIYPHSKWATILEIRSPSEWLDEASKAGISNKNALMLFARRFDIPYKEASELSSTGIWVPNGVYIRSENTFYSRELTDNHFKTDNEVRLGLIVGDVRPSSYLHAQSKEEEDAKNLIRNLYSSIMDLSKPGCEYTHFSLTGHHLSALCGTKDVLYRRLDEGFTPLLEMSRERASGCVGKDIWEDACQQFAKYIQHNPTRRFSFFNGDMTNSIFSTMKQTLESSTIFKVVEGIPSKATANTVAVVDFDKLSHISENDLHTLTSVHTLFTSKEKTLSRLYDKMRTVLGKVGLILHLAVYSTRVLGTKVCQNCCESSDTPAVLTDGIYGLSINVKRPPIVGPGCSSCVSGYAGSILLTEDCFIPGLAGAAAHSFEVDQDDVVRSELRDPFKFGDAILRTKKVDSILDQLESEVTLGTLSVDDARSLLN
ncbi:MAG: hypothetical protein CBC55_03000 [Gammaproteobacteria bacterium TMED95]|nr:MAG: hypothetical protein CBC55_03000 [Gammaproteobacteria bacterium TMED95]